MSTSNRALRALFLLGVGLAFLGCGPQAQKPVERENDATETPDQVERENDSAETPNPVRRENDIAQTPDPVVVDEIAVAEASPRVKASLQEARRRFDESNGTPRAFIESLWNVWDELPLVSGTTGDPNGAWTKVRLNAHGAGFDAVRFRNPLSSPAELYVVLARPDNPSFRFGILRSLYMPKRGGGGTKSYRKANLLLDGLDLHGRSEIYFSRMINVVFRPGDECCLWLTFGNSDPIDVYLAPRFVEPEPGEQEPPASAAEIAEKVGFELPFRYTQAAMAGRPKQAPPEMNRALEKALQLLDARGSRGPEFAQTLENIKLGFAEIPAIVGDQDPGWTTVRLDAANLGFDVVRFSNPTDEPADMVWAFALPEGVLSSWYITSATAPDFPSFRSYQTKECLDIPDLDLPERNEVTFQRLGGGRIHPGHDYFVWFRLQTPDPVDMQVKLRLLGPEEQAIPPSGSAQSLAECLGFELPFRLTDAASLVQRTRNLIESRGFEAGMEFLEKELENTPDREAEYFYVVSTSQYGQYLAKTDETRDPAVANYFKAAKAMRRLHQRHEPLSDLEQDLLRTVLYNEACGLALTGQPEKAAESLREAIQAGYNDRAHILADDDLREVRDLPVFDELIEEIDETPVATSPPASPEPIDEFAFPSLTAVGEVGTVEPFDPTTAQLLGTFPGDTGGTMSLVFSPNGTLVAGYQDGAVKFWDPENLKLLGTMPPSNARIDHLALSRDGSLLAVSTFNEAIRLWDTVSGRLRRELVRYRGGLSIDLSPDGTLLASWGANMDIQLFDVDSGKLQQKLEGHTERVARVCFSADGSRLASGSQDGTLRIWSLPGGELRQTLSWDSKGLPPGAMAFAPDGSTIIGSWGIRVTIWDLLAGTHREDFWGQTGGLNSVSFHPDGSPVATGGGAEEVYLRDAGAGDPLATIVLADRTVTSVAFSPDGSKLAIGGETFPLQIWGSDPNGELPPADPEKTAAVTPDALAEPSGEVSMAGLTADEDGWILLPPLVQDDRDTLDATWKWDGQVATLAAGKPRARVSVPLTIVGSYELRCRVTVIKAREGMTIILPVADRREIRVQMKGYGGNSGSTTTAIRLLKIESPPQSQSNVLMQVGTECALSFKVVRDGDRVGVEVRRDGRVLYQWAGLVSQVDEKRGDTPAALGVDSGYYSTLEFRDLQLRMLAGQLTPTYPQ